MQTDLEGRSAVVLGGTKGIGRAAVIKLAQSGASVVIQGRDARAAQELIAELKDYRGMRLFVESDLLSYEGIDTAVRTAKEAFERVDIIVASGGPKEPRPKLFVDTSPEEGIATIESRLMPRLHALHAAVRYMGDQGYGKVILLTTDAARIPTPAESMIGAAGAVVMSLTRSLAQELAGLGIRVNAIATTLTTGTPGHDTFLKAQASGSQEVIVRAFNKVAERVKFRMNSAEDLAEYILFLASPESDQISGSTISINGGLSFPSY
ncbi:SDR family oxidoreductase [Paracoccus sp. N5]|uniref:SDR family NAD(P)-dependent oxidoreductase n=1 Tax=Paracoccus sp. N5 TaxID=1101189 RepID=UPI00035C9889|nr:SDR family oxidoreductase [Paracoccus sp. N5]